jgi:hypothetical protein
VRGLSIDDRTFHGRRKIDMNEEICWEKVILTGLIDHTNHPVALGIGIAEGFVDLSDFEGGFVPRVPNTDDEVVFFRHDQSR